VSDTTAVSPDGYSLDNFYLARPGADEVQLDLFSNYKSNVALYPTFQEYFRKHKPFLAVWGKNDPFFLPAGAEAFKRDIPGATVRFFDTGHFALETHAEQNCQSDPGLPRPLSQRGPREQQLVLRHFEIACMLKRFDHLATIIVNANHSVRGTAEKLGVADSIADESIFTTLCARRNAYCPERL
jgi:hypothetical protein